MNIQIWMALSYLLFVGTFEPRKNIKDSSIQTECIWIDAVKGNPRLVAAGSKGWGDVDLKDIILLQRETCLCL